MSGKLDASITLARVLSNRNGSTRGPAERVSFTAMGLGAGRLGGWGLGARLGITSPPCELA